MHEKHGYFTVDDVPIYVGLHTPEPADSGGSGVLLLGAFVEERKSCYRLLVRLARRLAAAGAIAVRPDFSGTGESGGAHRDATLQRWLADARAAVAGVIPASEIRAAVGVRLGANLAVRLAADGGLDRLVLVEPILKGNDYMRELLRRKQIKEMMNAGHAATASDDLKHAWAEGAAVDFDGFEIGSQLAAELQGLSLVDDLQTLPENCAVQLLRVTPARDLPKPWQTVADMCTNRRGATEIIREKPFWGQVEYHETDTIINAALAFLLA